MRPGCGLKFREGWFHTRHTPPSAPTSGGKTLLVPLKTPKPLPLYKRGKGGLGPGSLCELCPEGRKEEGCDTQVLCYLAADHKSPTHRISNTAIVATQAERGHSRRDLHVSCYFATDNNHPACSLEYTPHWQ